MRTIAFAVPMLAVSLAHADMDCGKGTPWRLPVATPPLKHMEAPIKIDGQAQQMVMICNCTADVAGRNAGVWLRAYSESTSPSSLSASTQRRIAAPPDPPAAGDTQGYYLPARSCVLAGTATIILAPVDDNVESWGWFALQP